jgi:hypothetical protein
MPPTYPVLAPSSPVQPCPRRKCGQDRLALQVLGTCRSACTTCLAICSHSSSSSCSSTTTTTTTTSPVLLLFLLFFFGAAEALAHRLIPSPTSIQPSTPSSPAVLLLESAPPVACDFCPPAIASRAPSNFVFHLDSSLPAQVLLLRPQPPPWTTPPASCRSTR